MTWEKYLYFCLYKTFESTEYRVQLTEYRVQSTTTVRNL